MGFRQLAYLPDRRSTRIEKQIHAVISGLDASRAPYQEKISTISISCHGCRYLSRNRVLAGDLTTLEVFQLAPRGARFPIQTANARVRSAKQFAGDATLVDVAVELENPRDIWGIPSPPEDWAEFVAAEASSNPSRELQIVPRLQPAKTPKSAGEPLDELCSRLEDKATKLFESLVGSFVKQLTDQLNQLHETAKISTLNTPEDLLREFQQAATNQNRRMA